MGAIGSAFGLGPAHEVQSARGTPGFTDFGDDSMGGLMRNGAGMSRPDSYNGGGAPNPFAGGFPGMFPPGMGGMGGMGGGMQMGGMGGQGSRQSQGNPYGIQPPQGLQGGGGPQQQAQQNNPLAGLFSMLGGL